MSRKVNVALTALLVLSTAPNVPVSLSDSIADEIGEGLSTRLHTTKADIEMLALDSLATDPADPRRLTMGIDLLIRADDDADWGGIDRDLRRHTQVAFPSSSHRFSTLAVLDIRVTDSR